MACRPFSDVSYRKRLQRSFHVYSPVPVYVVHPTGMVLQRHADGTFLRFGALGYPFSDLRITFIEAEDDAIAGHPSLTTLLTTPERDYVITSRGEKVPVYTFEDKVVALYFYRYESSDKESMTEKLKVAYEELAKIKKVFEVMLVYFTEPNPYMYQWGAEESFWVTEESFWEKFKTMPWLALPFGDRNIYKRLLRIFKLTYNFEVIPEVLIVGPHAEFIEPFGARIMFWPNDPFTRMQLAELETEKSKELKLQMLWHPKTVFRSKYGSLVPFNKLSGKRVTLVLETSSPYFADWSKDNIQFLEKIKERYFQLKGTDDEFEVIYILSSNKKFLSHDMPWLVSVARVDTGFRLLLLLVW